MYGRIYRVSFAGVAVAAAQDLFEIANAAGKIIVLHKVVVGKYVYNAAYAQEDLGIQVVTGYATTGSGGSAATAIPRPGDAACSATCKTNNTTVATSGTPLIKVADTWNLAAGWLHLPTPEDRVFVTSADRLVVRITAPNASYNMNGYIVFEEIG
jgi:hypothetical protein